MLLSKKGGKIAPFLLCLYTNTNLIFDCLICLVFALKLNAMLTVPPPYPPP